MLNSDIQFPIYDFQLPVSNIQRPTFFWRQVTIRTLILILAASALMLLVACSAPERSE